MLQRELFPKAPPTRRSRTVIPLTLNEKLIRSGRCRPYFRLIEVDASDLVTWSTRSIQALQQEFRKVMKDQPEQTLILAVSRTPNKGNPLGGTSMSKDDMLLLMLDTLIQSWLANYTPVEIGSDLEKVRLLKEFRAAIDAGEPTSLVRQVYQEVFLRDVWGVEPGGATETAPAGA